MTKTMIVGGYELSGEEEDVVNPPPRMHIAPTKPSAFKFPSGNRQPVPNPPLAPNPPPAHPQPTRPANTANKSNARSNQVAVPVSQPLVRRRMKQGVQTYLLVVNLSSPVKHVQSKGKERAHQNQADPSQPPASLSRERDMNELRRMVYSHEATITRLEKKNASLRENRNTQSECIDGLNDSLTAYTARLVQLELGLHTLQTTQLQAAQAVPVRVL
ncbi:hypothetical protein FRC09_004642 [Ceratobasidium sp. 395]|nr:hypothetical protein FRC09_004642 [Ceratobasidium sp. 395]